MKERFDKTLPNYNLLSSFAYLVEWNWALVTSYEDKVKQDWQFAQAFLKDKPNGTKLPYTAILDPNTNMLSPREKYLEAFLTKTHNTIHSYIKIEDQIYQLATGKKPNAFLGKGSFGKIKFVEHEGHKSIVKIERGIDPRMKNEFKTLKDLSLTNGRSKRPDSEKVYTQMPYLGRPIIHLFDTFPRLWPKKPKDSKIRANLSYFYLNGQSLACIYADKEGHVKELSIWPEQLGDHYYEVIRKLRAISYPQRLTDEVLKASLFRAIGYHPEVIKEDRRFEIAIDICLEVANLNEGRASLSGLGYAHLDLTPENITIDLDNNIHLIDYGLAEQNPLEPRIINQIPCGTESYLPFFEQATNLNRENFDMLALRRTLFLPLSMYSKLGHETKEDYEQKACSVLTQKMLTEHKLSPYIDTSSSEEEKGYFTDCNFDARTLAAILIVARLNLNLDYSEVIKNRNLGQIITSIYTENKSDPYVKQKLENALQSRKKRTSLVAFGVFSCRKEHQSPRTEEADVIMVNYSSP